MNFIKKHKGKIQAAVCIIAVLAIAFFYDGSSINDTSNPEADKLAMVNNTAEPTEISETAVISEAEEAAKAPEETNQERVEEGSDYSKVNGMDEHNTVPAPDEKPVPAEPEKAEGTTDALTCTLSIRCDNAVGKSSEKAVVIPDDGVIFAEQTVVFYEGESVFHVLVREMKRNKIHLEFVNTPIYNSAYIEGINNLYEYDCGELSGWMYKVNGRYPNYGCSQYEIKNGDKIEWVYTCDLGKDVGGDYSARNGMQNE